jgi:hypothetical protein
MRKFNIKKSDLLKRVTRKTKDAAMLLLLRRPIRNAVTFCAFEKIRKPMTAEKRHQELQSICERKGA